MRAGPIFGDVETIAEEGTPLSSGLVEEVEFFAGLEADGFAGSDADFGSGARVAAYAGFAGFDVEDSEAA